MVERWIVAWGKAYKLEPSILESVTLDVDHKPYVDFPVSVCGSCMVKGSKFKYHGFNYCAGCCPCLACDQKRNQ